MSIAESAAEVVRLIEHVEVSVAHGVGSHFDARQTGEADDLLS